MPYGDGGFYFLQPVGSGYSGVDSMGTAPRFRPSRRGYSGSMTRTREDAEASSDQGMSRTRSDSAQAATAAFQAVAALDRLNNVPLTEHDLSRIYAHFSNTLLRSLPKNKEVGGFTPEEAAKRLNTMQKNFWGKKYTFGDLPYIVRGREYMGQWIKQNIIDPKGYSGYGDGGFYFLQPVGSGYSGIEYSGAGYGGSMTRVALENEAIGADVAKIAAYWVKSRIPAYKAEVDRINKNSKGDCARRNDDDVNKGAVTGAGVGSVVPVVGTAAGALWGAAAGAVSKRLSWDKDNCSDARYENYKKALANYAEAVKVGTDLAVWKQTGKSKYSQLPRFLLKDAAAVSWIKTNIIDPRYAPTGSSITAGGVTAGQPPATAGSKRVSPSKPSLTTPGKMRPGFAPSKAASAPVAGSSVTEAPVADTSMEQLPAETATMTETVTSMGPQVVPNVEQQVAAAAQIAAVDTAVATVDAAAMAAREDKGFLQSNTGKIALGVAAVGLVGVVLYNLTKRS